MVAFNLFLTYMQHKIGTFAEWPKPLGLIFIAVFGVLTLTILTWMYQDTVEIVWSSHRLLFSWKFGRPS